MTLTAENWLGFSSTQTKTVTIDVGRGLFIIYDEDIKFELKTSESNTVFVRPSSTCRMSVFLTFNWTLVEEIGYSNQEMV